MLENQSANRAADRDAVVASDIEHQRIGELQIGETDHQAAHHISRHRHNDVAIGSAHQLRQRTTATRQQNTNRQFAVSGVEEA